MVTEDTWRQRKHGDRGHTGTGFTRRQGSHGDRGHIETAYARRQDAHIAERRDTERGETDGDRRHTENTGYEKISSFFPQEPEAQKKQSGLLRAPPTTTEFSAAIFIGTNCKT